MQHLERLVLHNRFLLGFLCQPIAGLESVAQGQIQASSVENTEPGTYYEVLAATNIYSTKAFLRILRRRANL